MGSAQSPAAGSCPPPRRNPFGVLGRMRSLSTFLIALILFVLFTVLSPRAIFISPDNLFVFLATEAEFAIIAIAVGILMVAGEFDLSVGSVLAFCSLTFVRAYDAGLGATLALLISVAVGMAVGFLNGIITVKAQIPSFITTLGGLMMWRGITLFWSGGQQAGFDVEKIPVLYKVIGGARFGFIPVQFIWLVGLTLVAIFFMHAHKTGNWVTVTGDNRLAAKAMGISTDRIKIACFMLVGAAVGFVAVMQIFRANLFTARAGENLELSVVAAAVIGGISLTGGIGSVAGVFWGAMAIALIENGLVMMRIPYWWTFTVFGGIILLSVIAAKMVESRRAASA